MRFADSLLTLQRVRAGANLLRVAVDTATQSGDAARRAARGFAGSLGAQKALTNAMVVESHQWRAKARRRGLINYLLLAGAGGLTYLYIKP